MSKKDTTPLSTHIAKDLLISASYYKDSMDWALHEVLDHFKHKIDLSGYDGDKIELLDDITICDQPPEGFVFVFEIGHDLPVNIPVRTQDVEVRGGGGKLLCKLFLATICRIWMRFSY